MMGEPLERIGPRGLVWRWLAWVLCVAVWTAALLTTYPAKIKQAVLPEPLGMPAAKTLHVAAYAFLTATAAFLHVRGGRRWLLIAFLSLHGCATEYLQNYVPGRDGSLRDVALDHAGIALGLLLSWHWWRPLSDSERVVS
jgi:VanZ family protein